MDSFITALLAMFIGIYTLVCIITGKRLLCRWNFIHVTRMSAFVLQKTIRDNEEDTAHERKYEKAEEEL